MRESGLSRVRRHVWVSGQVQGVGFRASCAYRAGQLGLGGWVRNLPDGRVEAVFEGQPDAVDSMVSWCRRGPRLARVSDVRSLEEEAGEQGGFSVRR